jgi:ubiquinone biosynthesis protein UbiJ
MNIAPALPKMAGAGLADFWRDIIERLDIAKFVAQLTRFEESAENLKLEIERKTGAYRRALDEQYNHIFENI